MKMYNDIKRSKNTQARCSSIDENTSAKISKRFFPSITGRASYAERQMLA